MAGMSQIAFVSFAEELSQCNPHWEIRRTTDVFGTEVVYLTSTLVLRGCPLSHNRLADAGEWESDDEVAHVAHSTSSEASHVFTSGHASVQYFITFSDAYRIPEIYFRGYAYSPDANGGGSGSYVHDPEAWNAFFGDHFDTSGDTGQASRPIVGVGFCEVLGLSLMSLHQCDTEDILRLARQNGVRELNTISLLLTLVGPLIGMPSKLLTK